MSAVDTAFAVSIAAYLDGNWELFREWSDLLLVETVRFMDLLDDEDYVTYGIKRLLRALALGAVIGNWDGVLEAIGSIRDISVPEGGPASAVSYCCGLSRWFANFANTDWVADMGSRKDEFGHKSKLIGELSREGADQQSAIDKYVKYWDRTEKAPARQVAIDFSFLYHVAKKRGTVLPVPPSWKKHLIEIPDDYGNGQD